jgi:hypothetical protein
MMFNRALTIKSDVNGLLDIARATFCEYVDLLEEYVQVLLSNHLLSSELAPHSSQL